MKRIKQPAKVVKRSKKGPKTFSEKLEEKLRNKNVPKTFLFNYHTIPFIYFHELIGHLINSSNKYRKEFWHEIPNGVYEYELAENYLKNYKSFIKAKMHSIIKKYSIIYWLHFTRRIAPNTLGDDRRPETIMVCRNIISAAIQKFGLLQPCGNIRLSTDITIEEIFEGLLMQPKFAAERQNYNDLPAQLVLTKFNENNLLEYYELERLAYELWLAGSKSRVIAKGANLVVDNSNDRILLDDRSKELERLIENYDKRLNSMTASATGTVFKAAKESATGHILLIETIGDRLVKKYSDPITEMLGLEFYNGGIPNFGFRIFDIRTYLQAHIAFGSDFNKKWNVKLEYVLAVLTDIGIVTTHELLIEQKLTVATNLMLRGYRIYHKNEYMEGIKINWAVTNEYLGINIPYDDDEIEKSYMFLSLNEVNQGDIFVDSFGPLKVFIPTFNVDDILIDLSVIGDVLYNLFHSLPLKEHNFKGDLLEKALKTQDSYLPTTESKALDGTAKQVDFSFANEDILVLVECKAVARSFGIFGGQTKAIEHRLRNVIHKGLNDVDEKVNWFLAHPKGTNFDISHFKYIIGIAVSPFTEFVPSWEDKYWLNNALPRVLTISEFEAFMKSDLKKLVTKNLIEISHS